MKKAILAGISATALLTLSACGDPVDSDDIVVEDEAVEAADPMVDDAMAEDGMAEDDVMADDAMTEDGAMDEGAMAEDAAMEDGADAAAESRSGNSISISRDGVKANVEGVEVNAKTDGDVTVE